MKHRRKLKGSAARFNVREIEVDQREKDDAQEEMRGSAPQLTTTGRGMGAARRCMGELSNGGGVESMKLSPQPIAIAFQPVVRLAAFVHHRNDENVVILDRINDRVRKPLEVESSVMLDHILPDVLIGQNAVEGFLDLGEKGPAKVFIDTLIMQRRVFDLILGRRIENQVHPCRSRIRCIATFAGTPCVRPAL